MPLSSQHFPLTPEGGLDVPLLPHTVNQGQARLQRLPCTLATRRRDLAYGRDMLRRVGLANELPLVVHLAAKGTRRLYEPVPRSGTGALTRTARIILPTVTAGVNGSRERT